MGDSPKPVKQGKHYHALVIYNHARIRLAETDDTKEAKAITEKVVRKLKLWGYDKTYYHDRDALPGRNVFTELFRVIKQSEWVIVVFTKAFLRNCWAQYTQMAAFNELIHNHSEPSSPGSTFLPVLIDMELSQIPENITVSQWLSFAENEWKDDSCCEWEKLKDVLNGVGVPHGLTESSGGEL